MQNKMSPEEMGMVVSENQEEENTKRQDSEVEERQGAEQSIKVTARDRELVGHVALMRYAAERHLQRLVFASPVVKANRKRRTGEALDVGVMRRRLRQLSRGKGALLRTVEYRDQDGALRRSYCVTALWATSSRASS